MTGVIGRHRQRRSVDPACCSSEPDAHWPFAQRLEQAIAVSCRFDPLKFSAGDFERLRLFRPESIARSVPKRQAEFLVGRHCAREALRSLLHAECSAPAMHADGAPAWPDGICGSITHSRDHAIALVAPVRAWRGLGIDLEQPIDEAQLPSLAKEILTLSEQARFGHSISGLELSLVFSLKESLFKALYPLVGQRFYFEAAEVLSWNAAGRARLRLLSTLSEEWRAGVELDALFQMSEHEVLSLVAIAAS